MKNINNILTDLKEQTGVDTGNENKYDVLWAKLAYLFAKEKLNKKNNPNNLQIKIEGVYDIGNIDIDDKKMVEKSHEIFKKLGLMPMCIKA